MEATEGSDRGASSPTGRSTMTRSWLIAGAAFLVVLLVVAVVVAIVEDEDSFAEGTPEARVQSFLRAVHDEENQIAHDSLSDELKEECGPAQFSSRSGRPGMKYDRISLKRTKIEGDNAFVTVRVTDFRNSGFFGTSDFSHDQRFALVRQDGAWFFSEFPWPYFSCGPYSIPRAPLPVKPPPVRAPVP